MLFFHKPGVVHLWRPADSAASWHGLRSVSLKTQSLSVGSTALSPISGIAHILKQDALVVALVDGSFHVIQGSEPTAVSERPDSRFTSNALSNAARQHFVATSDEEVRKLDVNCIHGMISYDSDSYFIWVHE